MISEFLSRTILRDVSQGYFRRFILDFISSIEVCMIAWETITVFSEYQSLSIFGTILYLNLLSKAYRYNILAGVSCPYALIQSYIFFFRQKVSYLSNLKMRAYWHFIPQKNENKNVANFRLISNSKVEYTFNCSFS